MRKINALNVNIGGHIKARISLTKNLVRSMRTINFKNQPKSPSETVESFSGYYGSIHAGGVLYGNK